MEARPPPPRDKINYSYAEALIFVWLKGCCPQTEVKSRKTKENGIFHLRENGPHSSDEGNPYIKTNLHMGCLRKIANKRGTQIASWAHIYMVFSVVWTGNQQCSVPHCLAILGQFWYLLLIKPIHGQNVSLWISTKSPPLSNSRPPGNCQKSNPDPPGNVFELIPGGCPGGGMYPVGIDWDINQETVWVKFVVIFPYSLFPHQTVHYEPGSASV